MSTPSPNDTVIGPYGAITDSSGNTFTITGSGTVDMKGGPLGYTANVIEAGYVNGNFFGRKIGLTYGGSTLEIRPPLGGAWH